MRCLRSLICLVGVCLAAGPAPAAFQTYDIGGRISYVYASTDPAPAAVGQPFTATLSFDPDAPVTSSGPGRVMSHGDGGILTLSMTVGGDTYSTALAPAGAMSNNQLEVWDNYHYDSTNRFDQFFAGDTAYLYTADPYAAEHYTSVSLSLAMRAVGPSPHAIQSPSFHGLALDPAKFQGQFAPYVQFSQQEQGGPLNQFNYTNIVGQIETMTLRADAVATPAPAGLVLGGIGVLSLLGYGGLRRRKAA